MTYREETGLCRPYYDQMRVIESKWLDLRTGPKPSAYKVETIDGDQVWIPANIFNLLFEYIE